MSYTHTLLSLLALASFGLSGCNTSPSNPEQPVLSPDNASLQRITNCGQLRDYLFDTSMEQLLNSRYNEMLNYPVMMEDTATADGADSASNEGPSDFSTTNVQEQGVDEIDLVKTDGNFLYTVTDNTLHIVKSWPADETQLVATLQLEGYGRGLFLNGDTLIVFESIYQNEMTGVSSDFLRNQSGTRIALYDISDRSAPTLKRAIDIEGYLADGRMIDGEVYAVLNHWMDLPSGIYDLLWGNQALSLPEVDWSLSDEALTEDINTKREIARVLLEPEVHNIINALDLVDVLPQWRDQVEGEAQADPSAMYTCSNMYRPITTSQYNVLSLVHLNTNGGDLDTTGILSNGWTLYASQSNLYVAQTSWWWWWGYGNQAMQTQIHKFELNPGSSPNYAASGAVDGWVYDQFAMSEKDGFLRIATSNVDWWWGWNSNGPSDNANNLFVLEDDAAGQLNQVGALTGLAPGEQIYASRMLGDRGYIVTFRQTDPLFTIDLSDPTSPSLQGELHLPGYSSYLHPMGEDHLLAVGMAGTEDGTITGLAINVFDVSDMSAPALAHQYTLESEGWSSSAALWDHHAFTYHRGVLTIPAYESLYDASTDSWSWFSGAISLAVDETGITEIGRVDHRSLVDASICRYEPWDPSIDPCGDWAWYATVNRTRYIEDNLYTMSDYGVTVTKLLDPTDEVARVLYQPLP